MTIELKRKLAQINQIIQWADEGLLSLEEMKEKVEAKFRELFPTQKVEVQDIAVDLTESHGEE